MSRLWPFSWGIHFIAFVREGGTDQFQPLATPIFGALKFATTGRFRQRIRDRSHCKVAKPEAVHMLIWAWMHLQEETIEEA
jgi:hypothetical protein